MKKSTEKKVRRKYFGGKIRGNNTGKNLREKKTQKITEKKYGKKNMGKKVRGEVWENNYGKK